MEVKMIFSLAWFELNPYKSLSSRIKAPIIKTPSEIFRTINKEKQILQGLAKRIGILRVQILSQSPSSAEFFKDDSILMIKIFENNLEIQITEPTPKPHKFDTMI